MARGLGVGVELHYLEVPTDELWRRIEVRNSAPPWDNEPIGHADLDEWLAIFQGPDAAELACSTPARFKLSHHLEERIRPVGSASKSGSDRSALASRGPAHTSAGRRVMGH